MRSIVTLSPVVLAAALASCSWEPDENDDGDEAFVSQAVEAILGRKPKGAAEVKALSDLSVSHGREAVVATLFEQPEYVAYWSQVLADDLEVQRSGPMAVDSDCLAPALLSPTSSSSLASHLAKAPAKSEYCVNIDIGPTPGFSERTFWAKYDEAEASYRYTPLTELSEPQPLRTTPGAKPLSVDEKIAEVSRYPDLEVEGAGATNEAYIEADGIDKVATTVDQRRYADLYAANGVKTCPDFNLTDVIEAAVRADRLDAAYRAYLPVMATFPASSVDGDMRQALGDAFFDVYLDRDPACMTCHTATYSTTDARPLNANWDRFYPIWYGLPIMLDTEGTVFSYDDGANVFQYGGDGGDAVRQRVGNLFRRANHISKGIRPWGLDDACVTNPGRAFDGFEQSLPADSGAFGTTAFAELGPSTSLGVLDLTDALSNATSTFESSLMFVIPDWEAFRNARGASDPGGAPCTACHDADASNPGYANDPAAPFLEWKAAGLSDQRLFSIIRNGSGQMPSMASTDAEAWDYVWWIRQNYPTSPAMQMENRNHAFLYLVSANIVNNVVDEVLGEDLRMQHGFARNPEQNQMQVELTMAFAEHYSLQDLLSTIVLSDAFNRKPPEDPGTDPYVLPMLPLPEAEVSPLVSPLPLGANANSEGDYVHKVSPAGLLHQVHEALGWPAPPIKGDPSTYPTQATMTGMGRYTSRTTGEREQFGIDTFLVYESEVATCQKPDLVRARDVNLAAGSSAAPGDAIGPDAWVDWIDLLVDDAVSGGGQPTWSELALAVKDRLLADPSFVKDEEDLIRDLWGGVNLDTSPLADATFSVPEQDMLREYCGMLLATPDFVLRGVRLAPPIGDKYDQDPVCLPGEVCGEAAIAKDYAALAERLGYPAIEDTRRVAVVDR